jgi:hypothetical protein
MNNKNTDSQKLKYLHLALKGGRKPLKHKYASQRGIVLFGVSMGGLIIIALLIGALIYAKA